MNALLYLISWTGWTKEDWGEFLYIFHPLNWMSKTGWTEEEWMDFLKGATYFGIFLAIILLLMPNGLAV